MTFPNELPEGKAKDLQDYLNDRQIKLLEADEKRKKERA